MRKKVDCGGGHAHGPREIYQSCTRQERCTDGARAWPGSSRAQSSLLRFDVRSDAKLADVCFPPIDPPSPLHRALSADSNHVLALSCASPGASSRATLLAPPIPLPRRPGLRYLPVRNRRGPRHQVRRSRLHRPCYHGGHCIKSWHEISASPGPRGRVEVVRFQGEQVPQAPTVRPRQS